MKKTILYIAGLLVTLVCSCTDEEMIQVSDELRITGELSEQSRTAFVQEGNMTHTHWVEGDCIGIHTDTESNLSYQAMSKGATTEFSPLGKRLVREEGKKVYAYYPHSQLQTEKKVYLPYTLGQYSDRPTSVFLHTSATIQGYELNLQFEHVFAYLRITVTADMFREYKEKHSKKNELTLEGSGIYIKSVEPISCYNTLFNLETKEITHGEDVYRVIYRCPDVNMNNDGNYTYLIPVLPQPEATPIDISFFYKKIVQDSKLYLSRIESKLAPQGGLQAGHVYNLNYAGEITSDSEQTALLEKFYQATGGDQWCNAANWLTDRPLNEWYGVNKGNAQYGYVHSLDLSYNNLTGELPVELAKLMDTAESIHLEGNLLTGDIPVEVKEHPKWNELGWEIVNQDFENGGGLNLDNSGLYAGNSSVTFFPSGKVSSLKEICAKNKLTQVILAGSSSHQLVRNLDAAKVNRHLDYQSKGLGSVIFTGAEEGQDNAELSALINNSYSKVDGLNWLYSYNTGVDGYSYIFDNQGQLVYIAPFRADRDNTDVYKALDAFLRSRLGEPVSHDTFNMNYYTSTDYSADGEVYVIQRASRGKGIDIVLMGEGFTDKDMEKGGWYEEKMLEATEKLFSMEPYIGYRDRFNVYGVKVVSPHAEFTDDAVHAIGEENSVALSYAALAEAELPLVGVIYNTEEYVGRSHCTRYSDGSCVAYSMDKIDNTIIHEMCGHGIASLADEYVEKGNESRTLPDDEIERLDRWHDWKWGGYRNVTAGTIYWSHLMKDNRFADEDLDIYEGAFYYGRGVYRSSENSMMRHNISWFNAPSREIIYKAVMYRSEGSGWQYDYEEFVKFDEAARKAGKALSRNAVPLTEEEKRLIQERHRPPAFVEGSWRDELKKGKVRVPLR